MRIQNNDYRNQTNETTVINEAAAKAKVALQKKRRITIAIISVVVSIAVILSAVFAIYTTSDKFKNKEKSPTLNVGQDEDGITRLTLASGDDKVNSVDISMMLEPFLLGYSVEIADTSVVEIRGGKLFAVAPGRTEVVIKTTDGEIVKVLNLEVSDVKGNVEYTVVFVGLDGSTVSSHTVTSGSSLENIGISLPSLPNADGYRPRGWYLKGLLFSAETVITDNITVNAIYDAINILFPGASLAPCNYKEFTSFDISGYAVNGSGKYIFTAETNLPGGMSLTESGILSGIPTEAGKFTFQIKATDRINGEETVADFDLTVRPRTAVIAFGDVSGFIYDGNVKTVYATVENIADGDGGTVNVIIDYGNNITSGVVNAGSYTARAVSLSGLRSGNYVLSANQAIKFRIAQAVADVAFYSGKTNRDDYKLPYNGKTQGIFAEVTNLYRGDTCEVTLAYDYSDSERIDVKNGILAEAVALSNPNYRLPDSALKRSFDIVKTGLSAQIIGNYTKKYASFDPSYKLNIIGACENVQGVSEEDAIKRELLDYINRNSGEFPGVYDVSIRLPEADSLLSSVLKNYDIAVTGTTLTIERRAVYIEGNILKQYDGTATVSTSNLKFSDFNLAEETGYRVGDDLTFSGKYDNPNSGINIPVTFSLGGEDASCYYIDGTYFGIIGERLITGATRATGVNREYNGMKNAEVSFDNAVLTGVIAGEEINLTDGIGEFEDSFAGKGKAITITSVKLKGADCGNYRIDLSKFSCTATADITPKRITVSNATSFRKVYDGTTTFRNQITLSGVIGGDFPTATGEYAVKYVGNNIEINFRLVSGGDNYEITGDYYGEIRLKDITAVSNIAVKDKEYDGSEFINSDNIDVSNARFEGMASGDTLSLVFDRAFFESKDASDYLKKVSFSGASLEGDDAMNYKLSDNAVIRSEARINKKEVTVRGTITKVYDGKTGVITEGLYLEGVVPGESIELNGSYEKRDVAEKIAIMWSLKGNDSPNYKITGEYYGAITVRRINSISGINVSSKLYDGTTDVENKDIDTENTVFGNIVAGEKPGLTFTAKYNSHNVITATKVVFSNFVLCDSSTAKAANYVLAEGLTFEKTEAAIKPLPIVLEVTGSLNKTYDGTNNLSAASFSVENLITNDELAVTVTYPDSVANDNYKLNIELRGTSAPNYTQPETALIGSIAKKALEVIVNDTSEYTGYQVERKLESADVSAASKPVSGESLTGYFKTNQKDVGTYNVGSGIEVKVFIKNGSGRDVTESYEISAAGSLTVTTATLTVGINGTVEKYYDGTNYLGDTSELRLNGIKAADVVNVDSVSFETIDVGKNIPISIKLSGSAKDNYKLASYSGEILPKVLRVTGDVSKEYDGEVAVQSGDIALIGGVLGETVSFTASYSDKNAASRILINLELENNDINKNYVLSDEEVYGEITKKEVYVTGSLQKVYDGSLYLPNVDGLTLSGVISGDNAVIKSAKFDTKSVGDGKTVGFTLTGEGSDNYKAADAKSGKITVRNLELNLGDIIKTYDGKTPFAYVLSDLTSQEKIDSYSYNGEKPTAIKLPDGETVSGSRRIDGYRAADTAYNFIPGEETVIKDAGGQTTTGNYNITYKGTLTINKRSVTSITASVDNASKTYDGTTSAQLNYLEIENAVVGDDISAGYESAAFDNKNAGKEKTVTVTGITLNGEDSGNYELDIPSDSITIKANIYQLEIASITGLNVKDKVYDGTTAAEIVIGNPTFNGTGGKINTGDIITISDLKAEYDTAYASQFLTAEGAYVRKVVTVTDAKIYINGEAISDDSNFVIYYPLSYIFGSLSAVIEKREISVDLGFLEETYNGSRISKNISEYIYQETPLAEGDTVSGTIYTTSKNVGTYAAGSDKTYIDGLEMRNNRNELVTGSYNISYSGSITIEKFNVTVSGTVMKKTYDGTRNAWVNLNFTPPSANEKIKLEYESALFNSLLPGNDKTVTVHGIRITGEDCDNYIINSDTLEINEAVMLKRVITRISGLTAENKDYDGTTAAVINADNVSFYDGDGNSVTITGDSIKITALKGNFGDAERGENKTVTIDKESLKITLNGTAGEFEKYYEISADVIYECGTASII